MKDVEFYNELLKRVFPYLQNNYELAKMKKELLRIDRYRNRLIEKIKELEKDE